MRTRQWQTPSSFSHGRFLTALATSRTWQLHAGYAAEHVWRNKSLREGERCPSTCGGGGGGGGGRRYLELLARRARLFQAKVAFAEEGLPTGLDPTAPLAFPPLTWVVENFFQDMAAGETPKQWLDRVLDMQVRTSPHRLSQLLPSPCSYPLPDFFPHGSRVIEATWSERGPGHGFKLSTITQKTSCLMGHISLPPWARSSNVPNAPGTGRRRQPARS